MPDLPERGASFGMGRGGGRGGGWRHRHRVHATGLTGCQREQMGWPVSAGLAPAEQELAALKQQAEGLERTLGELKSRIQELDRPASEAAGKETP